MSPANCLLSEHSQPASLSLSFFLTCCMRHFLNQERDQIFWSKFKEFVFDLI